MWKLIFCTSFAFFYLNLSLVHGAAYILPPQEKPAKYACEKGCYIPDLDEVLSYKQIYSPLNSDNCIQYTCNEDGSTNIYTCGVIDFPDDCSRTPGNKSLPYPKCCDGVSCPPYPAALNHLEPGPRDPVDPEPVDPMDPKPVDPEDPKPVDPEDPKPVDPVDPKPVDPVDPKPVDPVDPKPVDPVDPKPVDPVNPEPLDPVDPKPEDPVPPEPVESNPFPIIVRPKRPPTDPVCVYPAVDSTSGPKKMPPYKRPPYCPPRDGPPAFAEPVPVDDRTNHGPVYTLPVEPPKGIKSVDSAAAKPATGDLASPETEAEVPVYHGPLQTLPVEPPVTVDM